MLKLASVLYLSTMRIQLLSLFFLFVILQITWIPSVHSETNSKVVSSHHSHSSRRERAEKNFISWVERVGERVAAKQPVASLASTSDFGSEAAILKVITVDKKGNGNFRTIREAVNSIPSPNLVRFVIKIGPGVYVEKIKITKKKAYVTFEGAGRHLTKIMWNDTAASSGSTFRSATVSVMAPHFIARGVSFVNFAPPPSPGSKGKQAVAFQISGDMSAFYGCGFYGAQDTLYDHAGRHYFKNCFIEGSIDFIFGNGLSLYESCTLNVIKTSSGSLTAQKRKIANADTGFSFKNCVVGGSGNVLLGRAWGEYSRVVFLYTYLNDMIIPAGWYNWGIPAREKTAFYGEYKCSGPGANRRGRVAWSHELTASQAAPFMSLGFIDGETWISS